MLPCAESACNNCIQQTIQFNPKKEFDCIFCHKKHASPGEEGYPSSSALSELLKVKSRKVYRNAKVEELKEKLAKIKSKCGEFELSLQNGADQVREHCIRLRNQVHLETDILIEEAHELNESLISEIDKYEKDCIESFDSNTNTRDNVFDKFIDDLKEFYTDNTKYLSEFEINEKAIEEAAAMADSHLRRFKSEDKSLRKIQFNNKIAKFRKCQNTRGRALLGQLTYKPVDFDLTNLKQLAFNNQIVENCSSSITMFKPDPNNNYCFFMNHSCHFNMIRFDNDGKVLIHNLDILNGYPHSHINQFKVIPSILGFVIYLKLSKICNGNHPLVICGQSYEGHLISSLLITIDRNFTYYNHLVNFSSSGLLHMTANSSRILCIDSDFTYYYLDIYLNVVSDKRLDRISTQVGKTMVDVQINNQFVFFLCTKNKLEIFEIESGDLVKQIETDANQLKLVMTEYLILFDSVYRQVHLYEQFGEFRKLDEADLAQSLEKGFTINRNQSNYLAFYNSTCMNYTELNHL
jgi:hypothetical protein